MVCYPATGKSVNYDMYEWVRCNLAIGSFVLLALTLIFNVTNLSARLESTLIKKCETLIKYVCVLIICLCELKHDVSVSVLKC